MLHQHRQAAGRCGGKGGRLDCESSYRIDSGPRGLILLSPIWKLLTDPVLTRCSDADIATVTAVLTVDVGIDTPEFAAHPTGTAKAGAPSTVSRATLAVVRTTLIVLDANGLLVAFALAGIEIQELVARAVGNAARAALRGASRAAADTLVGVGAARAAGTAVLSARNGSAGADALAALLIEDEGVAALRWRTAGGAARTTRTA